MRAILISILFIHIIVVLLLFAYSGYCLYAESYWWALFYFTLGMVAHQGIVGNYIHIMNKSKKVNNES